MHPSMAYVFLYMTSFHVPGRQSALACRCTPVLVYRPPATARHLAPHGPVQDAVQYGDPVVSLWRLRSVTMETPKCHCGDPIVPPYCMEALCGVVVYLAHGSREGFVHIEKSEEAFRRGRQLAHRSHWRQARVQKRLSCGREALSGQARVTQQLGGQGLLSW